MEVALAGEPPRRGAPLPLSQLVEERRRSPASVPPHLLESKIYAKLGSNSLIEAEPAELHFSGFQLEKDYLKTVKLINISSEVMNIHIIPTQTRHFQTTYTKKYRLIPGLAYTLKVAFCPDEWRYFYDCVRVHCQGEENLLIPVHAYPVIDDLHIPPRIDLSAVPLGQRMRHTIPLRCSCPIEFEFQVYVLQPHEAFSVHPLTGVIPASGEARVTVTFRPVRYETCQVTIQLVVSQFNTRPYLCTVTGSCSPHLSHFERRPRRSMAAPAESVRPPPAAQAAPRSQSKHRSPREADKSKILRDNGESKLSPKLPLEVCTPAGVAKMLIKDSSKLNSKDLKEAISSGCMAGLPSRQMKEALFSKRVQQNVKEEQANHLRWQVHLGLEPQSEQDRRQILEEREVALHQYTVKRGDLMQEDDFAAGPPKLSSTRVIREAGQAPEGTPSFQFYNSFHWELRQRPLTLFQQAARKVAIQCRVNRRLVSVKKLADSMRNQNQQKVEEEETSELKVPPVKVSPSTFPFFHKEADPLTRVDLAAVPVEPVEVVVTTRIPFFKLQVPQHYKLMGHQPVSTWEAFTSYIPTTLARPLRSAALDGSVPNQVGAKAHGRAAPGAEEEEERTGARLSFTAPEALLTPVPANPLRIFNPEPGLQTYKPAPKYLESDSEFHLCPLPRYSAPGSDVRGMRTQTPRTRRKFQDDQKVMPEVMTWKNFASITSKYLSNHPTLTSQPPLTRTAIDYSTDTLALAAPPPIAALADDVTLLVDAGSSEDSGVQLSPEMIRAEFLSGEALVSNGNLATGIMARRQWERQTEETHRSQFNQMGRRAMARLKQLEAADGAPRSPAEASDET